MVGGKVIEICGIPSRPNVLWINCANRPYSKIQTCSVLIEKHDTADLIQIGDSVWWQSGLVYWTPQDSPRDMQGINFDIPFTKIGGSGVSYETACGNGQ